MGTRASPPAPGHIAAAYPRDYRLADGTPAAGWKPAARWRRFSAWLLDHRLFV